MPVVFTDNSPETLRELERASKAALEAVGNQAVSFAKNNVLAAGRIATGTMHDKIDHKVQGDTVYIGTNVKYAIYNEMGTGVYIAGGRKSPWAYKDAEEKWHWTRGMRPIHFLKNAAANHIQEFRAIILKYLKGG